MHEAAGAPVYQICCCCWQDARERQQALAQGNRKEAAQKLDRLGGRSRCIASCRAAHHHKPVCFCMWPSQRHREGSKSATFITLNADTH